MREEILFEAEEKMEKAVDHLAHTFRGIRTGRASPGLVEGIRVEYYGASTELKHMASIGIPEPRMIMIKPFDSTSVTDVVKAIQKSELGITPQSDGKIIRLVLPPLSEDRRKQLSSLVREKGEEARIAIRNVRRDANKHAKGAADDGAIQPDDLLKLNEEIDALTKQYESKIDDAVAKKQKEIGDI